MCSLLKYLCDKLDIRAGLCEVEESQIEGIHLLRVFVLRGLMLRGNVTVEVSIEGLFT